MTTAAPAITSRDLCKQFTGQHGQVIKAVNDVNLTINTGEVVAFLGPNGAGKTTTIDMLLGLSTPSSGTVEVFGRRPQLAAADGRIAAVTQTGGLLNDFTVEETVRVVASLFSSGTGVALDPGDVMRRADIVDIADRKVSKCSGGEQQRLKFALALLPDPDLIVLDEPTAGMDVTSRRAFWAAMRDDARNGRTVLFATHYLEEADDFADRIIMISGGTVVADGSAADIRAHAAGRVVSAVVDERELSMITRDLPAIVDISRRGGRIYFTVKDSDDLARYLLSRTTAHDIEIASHNLEDAFVALTNTSETNTSGTNTSGTNTSGGAESGAANTGAFSVTVPR